MPSLVPITAITLVLMASVFLLHESLMVKILIDAVILALLAAFAIIRSARMKRDRDLA